MIEQLPLFGRLELSGDGMQLFLDGIPITPGQVIMTYHAAGSEQVPARVTYDNQRGWYLHFEEFLGHTYINRPLTKKSIQSELAGFARRSGRQYVPIDDDY
jgi:hypothetical protein